VKMHIPPSWQSTTPFAGIQRASWSLSWLSYKVFRRYLVIRHFCLKLLESF